MNELLKIKDLSVKFLSYNTSTTAVTGINLNLYQGETLGIVGESGAGKSVTFYTLLGLLKNSKNTQTSGEILFDDKDLAKCTQRQLRSIRGKEISIIFQDPMTSLNPYIKVGKQIEEALLTHYKFSKKDAKNEVLTALKEVGISDPERRYHQYPHEFSGGMRQRIMIAMALITKPKILIADEPTTALDVSTQAQILKLITRLKNSHSMSIVFITHDLGIVAQMCDRVCIMYAGKIVEMGTTEDIFLNAKHPYTISLKKSIPLLHEKKDTLYSIPGSPPDNTAIIEGCPFAPRCYMAKKECFSLENITLVQTSTTNHFSSCKYWNDT